MGQQVSKQWPIFLLGLSHAIQRSTFLQCSKSGRIDRLVAAGSEQEETIMRDQVGLFEAVALLKLEPRLLYFI